MGSSSDCFISVTTWNKERYERESSSNEGRKRSFWNLSSMYPSPSVVGLANEDILRHQYQGTPVKGEKDIIKIQKDPLMGQTEDYKNKWSVLKSSSFNSFKN